MKILLHLSFFQKWTGRHPFSACSDPTLCKPSTESLKDNKPIVQTNQKKKWCFNYFTLYSRSSKAQSFQRKVISSISIVKKQYLQLHLHAVCTHALVSVGIELIFFLVTGTVLCFVGFVVARSRTSQFSTRCPKQVHKKLRGSTPCTGDPNWPKGYSIQKTSCPAYLTGGSQL